MEVLEMVAVSFILGMLVESIIRHIYGAKPPHNKSIHERLREIENESSINKSN